MEPRDPAAHTTAFQMQMQQASTFNPSYLQQLREAAVARFPQQPSQSQPQHQHQQQHQQHQQHQQQQQQHQQHQQMQQHQQQQQQQQQQLLPPQPQTQLQIQHHQQQAPTSQQPSPQSQTANRNPLLPSIIHTPSAVRFPSPNSTPLNPNPNPNPAPTSNPNAASTPNPYPPETPPHMIQHQLLAASSPPSGMGVSTAMVMRTDPVKRKRGRPRKYATDSNGAPLALSPLRVSAASPREKKVGRAPGKKTQLASLGSTGQGFTPHVLSIGSGEDVSEKITAFSHQGPWTVCILSANGAISNASLWHAGTSTGAVSYEGRFEVLSLSGLFLLSESGNRTGGLSVSLSGADGKVVGGRVAGVLRAASPIQVVVGTFFSDNRKVQPRTGNGNTPPYNCSLTAARHPSISMEPTHMENPADLQDPISGSLGGPEKEEHRPTHVMPLQSADWGGSHFDVESRGHSEQLQSHGGS